MKLRKAKKMLVRHPWMSQIVDLYRGQKSTEDWLRSGLRYVVVRPLSNLPGNLYRQHFGAVATNNCRADAGFWGTLTIELHFLYHFEGENRYSGFFQPGSLPFWLDEEPGWSEHRIGLHALAYARKKFADQQAAVLQAGKPILDAVVLGECDFDYRNGHVCSFELYLTK